MGEPSGTSAHGVARAIEELSDGRLSAVPASGAFTAGALLTLLEGIDAVAVIANVDTAALWAPTVTEAEVERYVASGEDEGPDNDWQVGHFVAIAGTRGRLVRDRRQLRLPGDARAAGGARGGRTAGSRPARRDRRSGGGARAGRGRGPGARALGQRLARSPR